MNDTKMTLLQRKWVSHYLETGNMTEAARLAGYHCSSDDSFAHIGSENFIKLQNHIEKWLDEMGLSDEALKLQLYALVQAKESRHITLRGDVDKDSLAEGATIVATGSTPKISKYGEWTETHTVIAIEVIFLQARAKGLDLAFRLRGLYGPPGETSAYSW